MNAVLLAMYSASSDAIRESNKATEQRKALRLGKTPGFEVEESSIRKDNI